MNQNFDTPSYVLAFAVDTTACFLEEHTLIYQIKSFSAQLLKVRDAVE